MQDHLQNRINSLIKDLNGVDRQAQKNAAVALGELGPDAKLAIPALIDSFNSYWVNEYIAEKHVADALSKIGVAAIPALIVALKNLNNKARGYSAWTLGKIGPDAKSAIPALIDLLKDQYSWVRYRAAEALRNIGAAVITLLIETLKNEGNTARKQAAEALGIIGIGSNDNFAIPALIDLLNDKEKDVRYYSTMALGNLGSEAKSAVPALIDALNDRDVRYYAMVALGKIGPDAKSAIPILIDKLKDEDKHERYCAAIALGKIGSKSAETIEDLIEKLIEIFQDTDKKFRVIAAKALGRIGASAIPFLIMAMKDQDKEVRNCAALSLRIINDSSPAVIEAMTFALKDESLAVRRNAALLLEPLTKRTCSRITEHRNCK